MAKKLFTEGNAGRPKGAQGKLTRTVKETVLAVFNELQYDPKNNLIAFAKKYPRDFYNISAKLIPTEVQATVEATINWHETKKYVAPNGTIPEADGGS